MILQNIENKLIYKAQLFGDVKIYRDQWFYIAYGDAFRLSKTDIQWSIISPLRLQEIDKILMLQLLETVYSKILYNEHLGHFYTVPLNTMATTLPAYL